MLLTGYTGDEPVALDQARNVMEHRDRFEGTHLALWGPGLLGRAHLLAGRMEASQVEFERWEQFVKDLGLAGSENALSFVPYVAEAHRRAGELARALELARDCVERMSAGGQALYRLPAELELARVLLDLEGPSSEAFTQARASAAALIEKTGARAYEPLLNEVDAERARLLGDTDTQHQQLREAQRKFSEMGATGHAKRVARELEVLGA